MKISSFGIFEGNILIKAHYHFLNIIFNNRNYTFKTQSIHKVFSVENGKEKKFIE